MTFRLLKLVDRDSGFSKRGGGGGQGTSWREKINVCVTSRHTTINKEFKIFFIQIKTFKGVFPDFKGFNFVEGMLNRVRTLLRTQHSSPY